MKPFPISLPENFKTRISTLYGPDGADWLACLPDLRASLRERWSLQKPEPVDGLSYNYLEFAHSPAHGPVVLKIGFPNPELATEINALRIYRGAEGVVRLLDWDLNKGALLMEWILPGHDLTTLNDEQQATRIAAKAMAALRQPWPEGNQFPTMAKWCEGFGRYLDSFSDGQGPLPAGLFDHASRLAKDLLDSKEDQYLLHGDLHHFNLLFRGDGTWITIDPKGVIGELACEVGPFLFNPVPDLITYPEVGKLLSRRLDILAEITQLDPKRLAAWSFCRLILAAIWSVEEGEQDLGYWLGVAELLRELIK